MTDVSAVGLARYTGCARVAASSRSLSVAALFSKVTFRGAVMFSEDTSPALKSYRLGR